MFLQQLGRGLRKSEGKDRLTVIDFVGNHRMFLDRILRLLYLVASPTSLRRERGSGGPGPGRGATSGITIDGISTQITRNNTLSMPADIIVVHIGTSDMYMSDPGGAPQRLGTLLDKLITGMPSALIVVAKIIPLSSGAAAVKTFNAGIPGIIQTRVTAGKHILLVDMNATFPSSGMSSDNVDPNPSGYAWMAGIWYDTISPLLAMNADVST